jgi:hypothetical protein
VGISFLLSDRCGRKSRKVKRMAQAAGIVIFTGGLTAANEVLFAPLAGHGTPWKDFNWRIVPATVLLAIAVSGLEKVSPKLAVGISYTALITVLFARIGNAPAPLENLAKVVGASKK